MNVIGEKSKLNIIGDLEKDKIMLIHGLGFDWKKCFKKLIESLKKDYCILVPELPGHNINAKGNMSSVEKTAEEIIGLLCKNNISDIKVAYGISLGASIVLDIALQDKIDIDNLMIDGGQYEEVGEMIEQFSTIMADQFMNLKNGKHLISPIKESMGYLDNNDVQVLKPMMHDYITKDVLYSGFKAAYSYDIKNRSEKLKMQVHIMFGGNEVYAKNSVPLIKEKSLKNVIVHEFDEKGHVEVLSREYYLISNIIKENCLQ